MAGSDELRGDARDAQHVLGEIGWLLAQHVGRMHGEALEAMNRVIVFVDAESEQLGKAARSKSRASSQVRSNVQLVLDSE